MGAVTVSCVKREKEKVLLLLFKYAVYKNTPTSYYLIYGLVLNMKMSKYLSIKVNCFPFFYQRISWYETATVDDYCPFNV